MKRLRILPGLLLLALLLGAAPAGATSTVCSDPRRAGVKAALTVAMHSGGAAQLEREISAVAESRLRMSVGGVSYEDPYKRPVLRGSHLILQSEDVSVAITISTTNRTNRAAIRVERTCYYDSMVPWQPYWRTLKAMLRANGYRIIRP